MEWGDRLSFMSWVGHLLFGFIAAYVFERLEAQQRTPSNATNTTASSFAQPASISRKRM